MTTDSVQKNATHDGGSCASAAWRRAQVCSPSASDHARRDHHRRRVRQRRARSRAARGHRNELRPSPPDGCMSTNDQVTLLASGAAGVTPTSRSSLPRSPPCAIRLPPSCRPTPRARATTSISRCAASAADAVEQPDRSPATTSRPRSSATTPTGAACSRRSARPRWRSTPTRSTCRSTACACGHQGAPTDPLRSARPTPRRTHVEIELFSGEHMATIRMNDLTHDYVHENSAYSSFRVDPATAALAQDDG